MDKELNTPGSKYMSLFFLLLITLFSQCQQLIRTDSLTALSVLKSMFNRWFCLIGNKILCEVLCLESQYAHNHCIIYTCVL